jgi:hypothetical protein
MYFTETFPSCPSVMSFGSLYGHVLQPLNPASIPSMTPLNHAKHSRPRGERVSEVADSQVRRKSAPDFATSSNGLDWAASPTGRQSSIISSRRFMRQNLAQLKLRYKAKLRLSSGVGTQCRKPRSASAAVASASAGADADADHESVAGRGHE